ncbi:MAG: hypothetical protein IPM26_11675 [Saprospiraceae bacterium]|jgi:hypothetical protein|nr:hypothetical protein [Saprospiraceae bacterium]
MNTASENVKTYWLYTLLSLVATIAFLMFKPEWFWICLPPLLTYFVKAMRWM